MKLRVHSRQTAAMHLLETGAEFSAIALWLGHEPPIATHRYVEANLAMKEKALSWLEMPAASALGIC